MLNRSTSLAMSTGLFKSLPGKLDIKQHSPSIIYISASLAMSTSVLKALRGKLDIKRHTPSTLYFFGSRRNKTFAPSVPNLHTSVSVCLYQSIGYEGNVVCKIEVCEHLQLCLGVIVNPSSSLLCAFVCRSAQSSTIMKLYDGSLSHCNTQTSS